MFKSGVFLTKSGHKIFLFLSAQPDLEKLIARTLCVTHQGIFRPSYILNNEAYFLDFCASKFPLIFFNINSININKPCTLGV